MTNLFTSFYKIIQDKIHFNPKIQVVDHTDTYLKQNFVISIEYNQEKKISPWCPHRGDSAGTAAHKSPSRKGAAFCYSGSSHRRPIPSDARSSPGASPSRRSPPRQRPGTSGWAAPHGRSPEGRGGAAQRRRSFPAGPRAPSRGPPSPHPAPWCSTPRRPSTAPSHPIRARKRYPIRGNQKTKQKSALRRRWTRTKHSAPVPDLSRPRKEEEEGIEGSSIGRRGKRGADDGRRRRSIKARWRGQAKWHRYPCSILLNGDPSTCRGVSGPWHVGSCQQLRPIVITDRVA